MPSTEAVRVTILNQTYSLVASEDGGDIQELARTVDELMTVISKSGNLDSTRTAVLACLHLADQLRSAQRDLEALRARIDQKAQRIGMLLDGVVD